MIINITSDTDPDYRAVWSSALSHRGNPIEVGLTIEKIQSPWQQNTQLNCLAIGSNFFTAQDLRDIADYLEGGGFSVLREERQNGTYEYMGRKRWEKIT